MSGYADKLERLRAALRAGGPGGIGLAKNTSNLFRDRERQARPRVDLCERIERIQGEKALEELELATAEWEGMPALDDRGSHDELMRRFERAARACQKRHAQ